MTTPSTLIHVRFAPDGSVTEIGERPPALTAQQWYNKLSERAGTSFQALSGGRGIFRLSQESIDALKAAELH
jgi:hypothetical protein